jgi:MYXO-CTERM domain-containing protein
VNGIFIALAFTLSSIWGQIQASGQIDGQLNNGTPDGATLAGNAITLASLRESGWQTERTTTTDAQGHFTFAELPVDGTTLYLPIAGHEGAWYYPAQPVNLTESPSARVDITVYDATQTDAALRYERSALLIAGIQPASLTVMEMSGLSNTDSKTVVGADPTGAGQAISARFPLPTGAIGFQPQRGIIDSQVVPTQDGMGLIWPVFPGRQELAFSYQLPYNGDKVAIDKVLAYPVGTFAVYVPEGGMEISSPVLQPQGATELGGRRYQLYTATDLSRGDRISVQITGINAAMTGPQPPMTAPLMVASGATLMLAGLGAAFAWRRRVGNQQRSSWNPDRQAESQIDERQQLIIEIAALDERHDQDLLPEDAYQATRAALMRRVISLSPDHTQVAAPSEQPVRTA